MVHAGGFRFSPRRLIASVKVLPSSDAQAYIAGIGRSGYATDPEYASKLNDILQSSTLREAIKGVNL